MVDCVVWGTEVEMAEVVLFHHVQGNEFWVN
jgi:hypothetical protein